MSDLIQHVTSQATLDLLTDLNGESYVDASNPTDGIIASVEIKGPQGSLDEVSAELDQSGMTEDQLDFIETTLSLCLWIISVEVYCLFLWNVDVNVDVEVDQES